MVYRSFYNCYDGGNMVEFIDDPSWLFEPIDDYFEAHCAALEQAVFNKKLSAFANNVPFEGLTDNEVLLATERVKEVFSQKACDFSTPDGCVNGHPYFRYGNVIQLV